MSNISLPLEVICSLPSKHVTNYTSIDGFHNSQRSSVEACASAPRSVRLPIAVLAIVCFLSRRAEKFPIAPELFGVAPSLWGPEAVEWSCRKEERASGFVCCARGGRRAWRGKWRSDQTREGGEFRVRGGVALVTLMKGSKGAGLCGIRRVA